MTLLLARRIRMMKSRYSTLILRNCYSSLDSRGIFVQRLPAPALNEMDPSTAFEALEVRLWAASLPGVQIFSDRVSRELACEFMFFWSQTCTLSLRCLSPRPP